MSRVACVVLAAGLGTRMRSRRPKVLHEILGRPMILRLLGNMAKAPAMRIVVVVGHEAEAVTRVIREAFPDVGFDFVLQEKQLGTGHAVATALEAVPRSCSQVVVVNGDLPFLTRSTVKKVTDAQRRDGSPLSLATMHLVDPTGYGRILRDDTGRIRIVREQRDCSSAEKAIHEVNAGLYCFARSFLARGVENLGSGNAQGEFYLTDLVEMATGGRGRPVRGVKVPSEELMGVNSRLELARLEEQLRTRVLEKHMLRGVRVIMPAGTWIEESVRIEPDTTIHPGCMLRGDTRIARGTVVGAGCMIADSRIGADVQIQPYCVLEQAEVRARAVLGPFARIRPGSHVGTAAHVGNFVELKKTRIGAGSKANHLSYLGDGDIGDGVNIGAGTIFCNYDGFGKHTTTIEDGVFIGSDSQMVAPVRIGKGSYVGSGSTITTDVPPDSLAVARARQVIKKGRAQTLRDFLRARKDAADRARGPRSA